MLVNKLVDIDRPDVIRDESKEYLSFKEVKDSLVKFLMQAEVPFQGAERLPIVIQLKYNELGQNDKSSIDLSHHVDYKATLHLEGIKVDKRPIYVLAVPLRIEDLKHSERNKILMLQRAINVIVFDENDWIKLGLDISGKNWLRPLTKKVLKSWARLLFAKITALGGHIESDFTLNDLFNNIDENVGSKKQLIEEQKVKDLKARLIQRELQVEGQKSFSSEQDLVFKSVVELNSTSVNWLEETINSVIFHALKPVDLRAKTYKDFFRGRTGSINPVSAESFGKLVYDYINSSRKSLEAEIKGPGVISIQDKRTFQKTTLVLVPTKSKRPFSISTPKETSGQALGFVLELKFKENSVKIEELQTSVISMSKTLHKVSDRLNVSSDFKSGIYLWSDVL